MNKIKGSEKRFNFTAKKLYSLFPTSLPLPSQTERFHDYSLIQMTQTPSSEVTDAISSEVDAEEQELDLGLHDLDASDTESYNNIHNICNRTTTQQQHIIITPDTYHYKWSIMV